MLTTSTNNYQTVSITGGTTSSSSYATHTYTISAATPSSVPINGPTVISGTSAFTYNGDELSGYMPKWMVSDITWDRLNKTVTIEGVDGVRFRQSVDGVEEMSDAIRQVIERAKDEARGLNNKLEMSDELEEFIESL